MEHRCTGNFPEKCEAWSLPEIQNLLTEHKMEKAVCSGCAVGLRTKDGSKALCKAWCVASPNEILVAEAFPEVPEESR